MPLIRRPSEPTPTVAVPADLGSPSADDRWAAARSMSAPGDVGALAGALAAETDARVREAILTNLARIGNPAAARAVTPLIRSDDAQLRTGALDALRAMPAAVAESLPELLADPDPDVRLLACELARDLPGDAAARLMCELLDREAEVNVCAAAVDVLAEIGGPEALPALARCAERFAGQPFMVFSVQVAAERIGAQPPDRLG